MHRTPFPKIFVLVVICFPLLTAIVSAQAKPAGEINVTKCWSYPMLEATGSGLASDGSRVFLGSAGAKIEALSLDGQKMWSSDLGGELTSNILALDPGLFLVTSTSSADGEKPGDGILRSLSKETGITNWTLRLPDAEKHFLGGFNGSVVVVSKSGVIQSVDLKNGIVKWKREIADGFVAEPVFAAGKVFVAATGKQIFGVLLTSGEIDSMRKVSFGVTALGETPTGEIIAGDERGNVSSFVGSTEKPYWRFKSGGEVSNIFTIGEHILAASHDNFVYYLVGRNGSVAWKKRLTGRVLQIANIYDRYALVSSFEDRLAVFTELSNGKVAAQIVFGEDERLVYKPVLSNGLILLLTNKAVYGYTLDGCPQTKMAARTRVPQPPV